MRNKKEEIIKNILEEGRGSGKGMRSEREHIKKLVNEVPVPQVKSHDIPIP